MIAAEGILTARGGVSSHAALVARQMGKVCVCGAAAVQIDYDKKVAIVAGQHFSEGDYLSIDGTAGTVYAGQIKTAPSEIIAGLLHGDKAAQKTQKYKDYAQLMSWCAKATKLQVRTNADTPSRPPTPSLSARPVSDSPALSTCSSKATASTPCAR